VNRRLVLGYLSLALLVLVVLEVPLAVTYRRNELQNLTAKVERDAVAFGSLSEDTLEAGRRTPAALAAAARGYRSDTGSRVVLVDRRGVSLVDSDGAAGRSFRSRPEIAAALAGRVATGTRYSQTLGHGLIYVAVPVASSGAVLGAVRITAPTSTLDARVHRYWLTLLGIAGIVLGLTALIGFALARSVVAPLLALERAASRAGEGDLAVRADERSGPPEVRSLASEFNVMVREIETLVRAQEAFVADASHQLRTPLTALRLRLENLARDVAPEGQRDLEGALAEVERLGRLVEGLLVLARADAPGQASEPVLLAPLVQGRADAWAAFADERGVALQVDVPAGERAYVNPERLDQVLDNLIANALEASPDGSVLRLWARDGVLHVVDEGPGMTDEQRGRAFDRFWRGADGRSGPGIGGPGHVGSGLGLAIVDRLARADGAEVELRRADSGGIDAVVRLRGASGSGPILRTP
jgi:signal transduction histidine kinase